MAKNRIWCRVYIQIQHLLKLNIDKVQANNYNPKFKYNTC